MAIYQVIHSRKWLLRVRLGLMAYRYLFSVDPSLTCSGWALFNVNNGHLQAIGKVTSLPPKLHLSERLADLQRKISLIYDELHLNTKDVLICESPTTMKDPKAAIKVEQVRSIFETLARKIGLYVPGRLNPRSVQHEVLGLKGKQIARTQVKQVAVDAVHSLYKERLEHLGFNAEKTNLKRHQDIVDAILIGSLAMTRITSANRSGLSLAEAFSNARPTRLGRLMAR